MAYTAPKTDWTAVDGILSTDLNRIEGNIENLAALRTYPTATGTGTAIVVTTGYFELIAGRSFTFIASANNSGAATTINADGTGAKNLYKPNTTAAPTIISGKAYTVWYNGTSFFVKASAEGDAVAGDVLDGKIFSNDEDTGIEGTMTNNGTVSTDISAKATEVTIAQGYHSGSGKVKIATAEQNKIITGNIKAGVTILGVAGKTEVVDTADANATAGEILATKTGYVNGTKITGTMTNNGTVSTDISAKATEVTIAQGYHSGSGKVKISATEQAKILPENIKEDVSILGVTGTLGKFEAGDYLLVISSAESASYPTIYTKIKEILINKTGIYRVSFDMKLHNVGSFVYGRVYKNGSAIGIERAQSSTTYTTYTEDISFTAGDYCQLYVKIVEGEDAVSVHVRNFKLGISFNYFTDVPTVTLD